MYVRARKPSHTCMHYVLLCVCVVKRWLFAEECTGSRPAAALSLSLCLPLRLCVLPSSECRSASALIDDINATGSEKEEDKTARSWWMSAAAVCLFTCNRQRRKKKRERKGN